MTVKGLFADEAPMRKSFHKGKEIRKTEKEDIKLDLLDSISNKML